MQERLQKLLSRAGIASRRQVEVLIAEGEVTINGKVAQLGDKADPDRDHVKVRGKLVTLAEEAKAYYLFYKPRGVLTSGALMPGRATVAEFFERMPGRLFTVGRLDLDTEGLILVTNDGDLAHGLMHPRTGIPKRYHVKTKGVPSPKAMDLLARGVPLEGRRTAPAEVRLLETTRTNAWLEVIIHEGRYRQVRRMFEHVGHTVLKLKRVGYAFLIVGDLVPGAYRVLTETEVKRLGQLIEAGPEKARPKPKPKARPRQKPKAKPESQAGNKPGNPAPKRVRKPTNAGAPAAPRKKKTQTRKGA
ncbi:MAG: rRNA pseudouridine synthase [Nitrospirota bacterium]|nr:rRNA pseudouridine synthase [Nitrospirota bacterium]